MLFFLPCTFPYTHSYHLPYHMRSARNGFALFQKINKGTVLFRSLIVHITMLHCHFTTSILATARFKAISALFISVPGACSRILSSARDFDSSLFPFAFFSLAFCLLVCWIACLSRWIYLDLVIFTLKGWRRSKPMSGNLWFCNLSIIISLETSLRNKKVL